MKLKFGLLSPVIGAVLFLSGASAQTADSKIKYVNSPGPCALSSGTRLSLARALETGDAEALQGLIDRGMVVVLTVGTKFEGWSKDGGFAWGFVRSGREIGRDCHIPQVLLQDQPPAQKK